MEGSEQVRTVLDMTADAWKKVYLTEDWPESVSNVLGLNLEREELKEWVRVAAGWDKIGRYTLEQLRAVKKILEG